jgi:hypothetical protein
LAITEHRQLNILILSPLAAVACPFLPPCRSAARKFNQSAVHIGCKRQALLIPENEAAGLLAAVERFDRMASVSKAAHRDSATVRQWMSNPVSTCCLPKTGVLQVSAGDFRELGGHRS